MNNPVNISIQFPSTTPGAVLDVKKNRASISFSFAELEFVSNMHALLSATGAQNNPISVNDPTTGIVDVTPETITTV